MAFLQLENRAFSALASGIGTADASLVLATGEGARFPASGDFHVSIFKNLNPIATDATREIVKVTARSTDTLTITRAQEGTSAVAHDEGDYVWLNVTAALIEEIETAVDLNTAKATCNATNVALAGAIMFGDFTAHGNCGADETVDWTASKSHKGTIDADTAFTFTDPGKDCKGLQFIGTKDASATVRTPTFTGGSTSVKWAGGGPVLSTNAGLYAFTFTRYATNTYLGEWMEFV